MVEVHLEGREESQVQPAPCLGLDSVGQGCQSRGGGVAVRLAGGLDLPSRMWTSISLADVARAGAVA